MRHRLLPGLPPEHGHPLGFPSETRAFPRPPGPVPASPGSRAEPVWEGGDGDRPTWHGRQQPGRNEGAAPSLPDPPPHPRQTPGETHPPAPPRKPVGRWRSGREGQTKGGNEGVPPTPVPPVPPRTTASPVAGCSAPRLPAAGEASPPPLREWGHPSPARGNLPGRGGFPSPPHRRQR